ncbi:MAG: hypothetical protein AB2693_19570 [Candidatus Thiodiazotropha sp.]
MEKALISPDLYKMASPPINIGMLKQELKEYDLLNTQAIFEGFTLGFPLHYNVAHSPFD